MPTDKGAAPGPGLQLWSLREDVVVESVHGGGLLALTRWGEVTVPAPATATVDSLYRMTLGPVALTNVTGLDRQELYEVLDRLRGCVVRSLGLKESATPLLSAVPIAPCAVPELPDLDPAVPVRLSRFSVVRERDGELVVESPLSHHRVVLHRPLATWVVGALGRPTTATDIARGMNVAQALVLEIIAHLVATGLAVTGERSDGVARTRFTEDVDPALLAWSPEDLLFHTRNRIGRTDAPAGAVFRHAAEVAPQPVARAVPKGRRFALPAPQADEPDGMTLAEAIERRRSVREFAEDGPTARQLGELLYRTARIRGHAEAVGAGGVRYPVTSRPYPSTGSLYELDLYLTVDRCGDLPRGIFHYDPAAHSLTLVNEDAEPIDELLDGAMVQTGAARRPPVLISMVARIGRLSWVYDGMAYAAALKHVGVLQQTLYLVATMLGLAPCALATGDDELATAAFGLDWPAEVSVGEFVVGVPGAQAPAGTGT